MAVKGGPSTAIENMGLKGLGSQLILLKKKLAINNFSVSFGLINTL